MTYADSTDAWVNHYVGVPYLVNGRDRRGWDCWGLVMAALRDQRRLELPDWRVTTKRDSLGDLADAVRTFSDGEAQAAEAGQAIALEAPEPWAIAMVLRHKAPNHCGLVVGPGVLHCAEVCGGTVYDSLVRFQRSYTAVRYWRWVG